MWPTTLDMTRDECRGVLRRLELETYSSIISTFRAQGGLSGLKIKLLEDLRNVFHISQDRHRAEARRVANDEKLCTIAETISGPNTTHEWNREGRRSFPLIPRSAPYTALSPIANGVADVVSKENSKLPYPSETIKDDRIEMKIMESDSSRVVIEDPVAITEDRRNLKRASLNDPMSFVIPFSRKRTISTESSHSNLQSNSYVHTNTRIQQLYHSYSKTHSRHKKTNIKRNVGSGRSKGSSPQSKQSQNKIQKPTVPSELNLSNSNKVNLHSPKNLHSYASLPHHQQQQQQQQQLQQQQHMALGNLSALENVTKINMEMDSHISNSNKWPQIATSKKDITNNLSKLNLPPITQQPAILSNAENNVKNDKKYIDGSGYVISDAAYTTWSSNPTVISTPLSGQRCNVKMNSGISGTKLHHLKLQQSLVQGSISSGVLQSPTELGQLYQGLNKPLSTTNTNNKIESDINNFSPIKGRIITIDSSLPKIELQQGNEIKKLPTPTISTSSVQQKTSINDNVPIISTKPKIHITSQQIISPAINSIKIPTGMQLKGMQGRKSVKIISSPSGKMFIQADNSKSLSKLGTVIPQKNILSGLSLTSATTTSPNRFSLQKFQIMPSTGSKQIALNKQNMVFMQTNVTNPSGTNVIVRNIPINKSNKSIQIQENDRTSLNSEVPYSNAIKNENHVIVIGSIPNEKNDKDNVSFISNKNLNETNMITEDTPVDILPSPLTNLETTTNVNQIKESNVFELKPPSITVVQTLSDTNSSGTKICKRLQLPQDLSSSLCTTKLTSPSRLISHHQTSTNLESEKNVLINTTDWEVELDQEVNKSRDKMENCMRIVEKRQTIDNNDRDISTAEIDNFNDMIEEETIDEDSVNNETITTEEGDEREEEEEQVEYDYGATEELDENVSIEYVEETANSSDEICEMYNDTTKIESDVENDNTRTNILPITTVQNISQVIKYKNKNQQTTQSFEFKENNNKFTHENPKNSKTEDFTTLDSTAVMFEMQEIDENGLSQIRNVTLEELIATGQIPPEDNVH